MMRAMKRKLKEKPIQEGVVFTWDSNNSTKTKTSGEEHQQTLESTISSPDDSETRIVSHVPESARGSVSSLDSSNSTLSSTHYHPLPSVSLQGESLTVGFARSGSSPKEPTGGFKRTISFVSGDLVKDKSSQETKRSRIEPISQSQGQGPLLLSTAKDSSVLSPLHIFVRQQIEVFQASEDDLKQPAPGRRIPIQLNQVGLRCIHCKHQKARERKKRAVCYPSSVGRVYHSVSDMKFAHFPCQQMPHDAEQKFAALKEECQVQSKFNKESGSKRIGNATASTAQYYHDSARELGMVDGKGGIYAFSYMALKTPLIANGPPVLQGHLHSDAALSYAALAQANVLQGIILGRLLPPFALANIAVVCQDQIGMTKIMKNPSVVSPNTAAGNMATTKAPKSVPMAVVTNPEECTKKPSAVQPMAHHARDTNGTLLASKTDKRYLTPIHCFVRRHVEVFAANEQDLAAPAPGRKKPIVFGQVGLRCVHCAQLPTKERVKRAICFPPSVSGVYHAVSNMKFDHFKLCKGMPQEAREEFQQISSSPSSSSSTSGKRGGGGGSVPRPRVSNSTAQYYHDSALRMGLCDTNTGIKFNQAATHQEGATTAMGARVPEGMEALVIAATDPKVRAAHEQRRPQTSAA